MAKTKAGDLYIASVIHVTRETKQKDAAGNPTKEMRVIQPGQMVSETDLTDEEVEDLKRHKGILRPPSFEEEQQMDSRDERKAQAEAVRAGEQEQSRLAAEQQTERDRLAAEQRAEEEKARQKLEADQAKEREDAAAKASKAVAGAGKKK